MSNAQNLVSDPSFEIRTTVNACYTIVDTGITNANINSYYRVPKILQHWNSPVFTTSAVINSNCSNAFRNTKPQLPYHDSSIGLIRIFNSQYTSSEVFANSRSYLQTKLLTSLKSNSYYKVKFYVNPTFDINDNNGNFYSTSSIGAYFSVDRITKFLNPIRDDSTVLNVTPQIINHPDSLLSDTSKWHEICGIFKAQGGEQWLTLGNFFNDNNTMLLLLQSATNSSIQYHQSYYFIDYVTVEEVKNINPKDSSQDTLVCPGSSFSKTLKARPGATHYMWSTGDTTKSIVVDSVGSYWLNADYGCGLESDTFKVKYYPLLSLNLGNDIVKCADGNFVDITAPVGFLSYLWNTGDTTNSIKVNKTGFYSLTVISACDTLSDTISLSVFSIPPSPLVNDTGYCVGDSISFVYAGQNLKWYEDKTNGSALPNPPALRSLSTGNYIFYISQTINGCESEKSRLNLSVEKLPFLYLGLDTILCGQTEYRIDVPDKGWIYHWNNGDSISSIIVDKSDLYVLTAHNFCGISKDSIRVYFQPFPTPPNVENSKFCNTEGLTIDSLKVQGSNLSWYNSLNDSISQQFLVIPNPIIQDTLRFFVSQTVHSCESEKASFYVEIFDEMELNWPIDTTVCLGSILLWGDSADADYLWSTNETTSFIEISQAGLYSVLAKNYCGTIKSSLHVYFELCSTLLNIPNVFTPNDDGIYDYFGPFGENFSLLEISIFNRWGNKIYRSDMNWDGRSQGILAPEGQYYYIIKVLDSNDEPITKKGILNLIR